MTDDSKRKELLEIYMRHAGLAGKVGQRREGVNRLYVSLLLRLAVLVSALLWLGSGNDYDMPILVSAGVIGTSPPVS